MLGHKSIKTTQHYAKIVDRKVSDDMMILKEKFALKPMNYYARKLQSVFKSLLSYI
jgi:hypothetical protein